MSNRQEQYKLNSIEDFRSIIKDYPRIKDEIMFSPTVYDAATAAMHYINMSSQLTAFMDGGSPMTKGLKETALAAGLALSTPAQSQPPQTEQPSFNQPVDLNVQRQLSVPDKGTMGKQPEDKFLWNIMQLESSGGKNLDHPEITWDHAMKGQTAMGKWGLLAPTVNELINRKRLAGENTAHVDHLKGAEQEEVKNFLSSNPHIELDFARQLARHVLGKHKGDESRAAYSWLHGHNMQSKDISDKDLKASDYVKNYHTHSFMNPHNKQAPIHKSEDPVGFMDKFNSWKDYRDAKKRVAFPRDSTYVADPGNKRSKDEDHVAGKSTREQLKEAIRRAKKT